LRSLGIPTSGSEWSDIGTPAGIASLAAMLLGALVGGVLGERWHSKLTRLAVSGRYRPSRVERQAGDDEPVPAAPARDDPREPDPAGQDRSGRHQSGGRGATRID
jgi:hypothetical protein